MQAVNLSKFFQKFPTRNLGDIVLREMTISDAERYLEIYQNDEVTQYLSDEDVPRTIDEARESVGILSSLFRHNRSVFWAIADAKTDVMIGNIGFCSLYRVNRRTEISYDLDRQYWGQGVMRRAMQIVIDIAFNEMNVYRIEGRTMLGNEKSQKLLRHFGFVHEGIMRGYRIIRNQPHDITLYSLLKKEYADILRTLPKSSQ